MSSSDEEGPKKNLDAKKILDIYFDQLVLETKNNRLPELKKLLTEISDKLP